MDEKKISTLDLHLIAFLEAKGYPAILEFKNNRVVGSFPRCDEIYSLMEQFNDNAAIGCIDYSTKLRTLKARMFALKQAKSNGGNYV